MDSNYSMLQKPLHFSLILFILQLTTSHSSTPPLNCTETSRLCTSFLAFNPSPNQTLAVIMSMFDVLPEDITVDGNSNGNGRDTVFVRKNCSCADLKPVRKYLTNTTYTARGNGESLYSMVVDAYGGLGYVANFTRPARVGAVVTLQLLCGCSNGLWNYLMSYVMKEGDSVGLLASRFGVSMDSIEAVNGIVNSDNVTVGHLYYIPLNSAPGEPYPVENVTPAPAPTPAPLFITDVAVNQNSQKAHVPYLWIIGSLGVGLALIIAVMGFVVCSRSSICFDDSPRSHAKDPKDEKVPHKFHILKTSSFCFGSRKFGSEPDNWRENIGESSGRHTNIPKVIGTGVFDIEKPVVFLYEELFSATDCFSESNLLGHGTYGAVYYGLLRDQEVAIKRMTETKTKEFMAEMKVLCKVHHTNLVELIGYAASDDELFLIYEYTQKGSLKSHLHDPQNKGHPTLSWIMRVQIALDTARGLEYIHEHTKPHYVHRDVKTSNILLDGAFKAKISDFGLAKLVGRSNDGEASVTRVVGTYGYLAPEYLRDGLATAKSDVYAFGVILFEIISGKDAIIRTEAGVTKNSERRTLASVMMAVLKNAPESISTLNLKDQIDPNLMDLYPLDCVFKMAMLAKQCVEDDAILRPDMKQVVISLSHILLSSVEWEATLAGNSQEVAIKRMTETKTKEFMAEMKVLCKVHHTNLVELIGYAASDDELFLIYEYAQKGSLKSHLHDPQNKGHPTLSWIMRVQIALDTARGLEYIHEHTKPHYVHRDVKTNNILLDDDGEASVTRVVGTYGYLAPEYLRDGLATPKSDVYAFGVILFEIISGKDAIIRTEAGVTKNSERRTLASVMISVLKNTPESISTLNLKDHIDPNLMDLYPLDCVFKMAMLAKQCVEDDAILRPDMKQVVISLSHILLSSVGNGKLLLLEIARYSVVLFKVDNVYL